MYNLIELIIEASLLTKNYSTFDTHTQHTCLMFNECLIHLFDCTCVNVMCVCSTIYGSIQKIFYLFICFWKYFLSLFVFMFSAYFVFHYLNMFCFWKASVRIFGYSFWLLVWATSFGNSFWRLASRKFKIRVHTEGFRDSLATQLATR